MQATQLDYYALEHFFYAVLDDNAAPATDKALALVGLAASGKPVLAAINHALNDRDPDPDVAIRLLWGKQLCGDWQGAEQYYAAHNWVYSDPLSALIDAVVTANCTSSVTMESALATWKYAAADDETRTAFGVLLAESLLSRPEPQEAAFTYQTQDKQYRVRIGDTADCLLSGAALVDGIRIRSVEGTLSYCEVVGSDQEDSL